MSRYNRHVLALLLGASLLSTAALAEEPTISVYKSPTCTCCGKWIGHLEKEGFKVDAIDTTNLGIVKSMAGISAEQSSCHTARVGDYVIEGHVPAEDIRRLLAEHPDARGLTVPGMPLSAPGMDVPSPQHYQVLLIGKDGSTSVFAEH
jgi:hypothetical protein